MKDQKFSEKREKKIGKFPKGRGLSTKEAKKVENKNFKCDEQFRGFPSAGVAGGAYGNWHTRSHDAIGPGDTPAPKSAS